MDASRNWILKEASYAWWLQKPPAAEVTSSLPREDPFGPSLGTSARGRTPTPGSFLAKTTELTLPKAGEWTSSPPLRGKDRVSEFPDLWSTPRPEVADDLPRVASSLADRCRRRIRRTTDPARSVSSTSRSNQKGIASHAFLGHTNVPDDSKGRPMTLMFTLL